MKLERRTKIKLKAEKKEEEIILIKKAAEVDESSSDFLLFTLCAFNGASH
jgi:uncharacterized protein (DUF1778 family)